MILAVYFGRQGGLVQATRSSILYGALTYYFVAQKNKRDAVRIKTMNINNTVVGNNPSAAAMQQMIQQMLANQSSSSTAASGFQSTQKTSSEEKTTKTKRTNTPAKIDAVDVEWEKVRKEEDVDDSST